MAERNLLVSQVDNLKCDSEVVRIKLQESHVAVAVADAAVKNVNSDLAKKEQELDCRKDQWARIAELATENQRLAQEISDLQDGIKQKLAETVEGNTKHSVERHEWRGKVLDLEAELGQANVKIDRQVRSMSERLSKVGSFCLAH